MPIYGDVAQLGEHHVRNVGVEGSSPFISTRNSNAVRKSGVFAFKGFAEYRKGSTLNARQNALSGIHAGWLSI